MSLPAVLNLGLAVALLIINEGHIGKHRPIAKRSTSFTAPARFLLSLSLPDRIFGLALRIPSGRSRRFGMSRKSNGRKAGSKITFQRECLQTGRPTRQVVW